MHILVTGGAGYIGSHTCIELLGRGHRVTVLDNLCNSSTVSLDRVQQICGQRPAFVHADLRDRPSLESLFAEAAKTGGFDAVIHFAALKAVGESVTQPLRYYENNISGSICLFEVMEKHGCRRLIFSSSATVYGLPEKLPISESESIKPTNPYGHTKSMMEQVLLDTAAAHAWNVTLLRYFNPVGAHPSGLIGEDPEVPNNLMPFVAQVAAGRRPKVTIFGDDWPTPDGTGVRDYLHVCDLAVAHVDALEKAAPGAATAIYNVGTGAGYSVKEMIAAFESACGHSVPSVIGPRRDGDVPTVVAEASLIRQRLGWEAKLGLQEMVRDAWNWQRRNPMGFTGALLD